MRVRGFMMGSLSPLGMGFQTGCVTQSAAATWRSAREVFHLPRRPRALIHRAWSPILDLPGRGQDSRAAGLAKEQTQNGKGQGAAAARQGEGFGLLGPRFP